MAEAVVQLPPDSTGSKVRTETHTEGANLVHQEVVTIADAAGTLAGVTAAGLKVDGPLTDAQLRATAVPVSVTGVLSLDANNSTVVALNANQTFTGTATDLRNYAELILQFYGSPASAGASLFFEFSPDGTNWDVSVPNVIPDPTFFIPYPLIPVSRWYRVRYINDGGVAAIAAGVKAVPVTPVNQTVFRLNTYLFTQPTKELARTLGQTVTDSQPVTLTRAALMGKKPDGAYQNVPISVPGRLFVHLDTAVTPTIADASASANHGYVTGSLPFPDLINSPWAAFGLSMNFSGQDRGESDENQGVDCGASVGVSGPFTLEAKIKKTRSGVVEVVAGKTSASVINVLMYFDAANKLNAGCTDVSSNFRSVAGATAVTVGKHDVAIDYDGTNLRVYLDGVTDGVVSVVGGLLAPDTVTPFMIGRQFAAGAGNGYPFAGVIDCVRLSNVARYAGTNYTPRVLPDFTDTNTTGLWHLDAVIGPLNTTALADEFTDFEAQDVTLVASTDTTITFAQPVRMVRVFNWDTANRVLIKNAAIATNTDAASTRVGVAPTASVAGSRTLPYRTQTIHLRSAGASNLSVEGYY